MVFWICVFLVFGGGTSAHVGLVGGSSRLRIWVALFWFVVLLFLFFLAYVLVVVVQDFQVVYPCGSPCVGFGFFFGVWVFLLVDVCLEEV